MITIWLKNTFVEKTFSETMTVIFLEEKHKAEVKVAISQAVMKNKTKQNKTSTHRLFVLLPAVVVCRHGDAGIAQTRLLGQDHLGHCGHVDDVGAPLAEHQALCPRREAGPLDTQHGAPRVALDAEGAGHLH